MMEDMHDKNSSNIGESLLESVTTDEGREDFVRSSSAISAGNSAVGGCSVGGQKNCQYRVPKNTLTFLSQIIVVYGIISVSVYHLSVQSPNQELWLILLSSAFGYILPSPGLKYLKPVLNTGRSTESADIDGLDASTTKEEENGRHS